MARKLKSDKLLFTATLLLVCTSIVMVYSASAVIATERLAAALPLPLQAGGLGADRPVARADRDAHRLPLLPPADRRSGPALGVAAVALVAVLFVAAGQRRQPVAAASGRSACSRRSWRRSPSSSSRPRSSNGAWIASTSSSYSLLPIGVVTGVDRRADPRRAGSRHRGLGARHRQRHGVRRRHQLPLRRRPRRSSRVPAFYVVVMASPYRRAARAWRSSIRGAIRWAAATR